MARVETPHDALPSNENETNGSNSNQDRKQTPFPTPEPAADITLTELVNPVWANRCRPEPDSPTSNCPTLVAALWRKFLRQSCLLDSMTSMCLIACTHISFYITTIKVRCGRQDGIRDPRKELQLLRRQGQARHPTCRRTNPALQDTDPLPCLASRTVLQPSPWSSPPRKAAPCQILTTSHQDMLLVECCRSGRGVVLRPSTRAQSCRGN